MNIELIKMDKAALIKKTHETVKQEKAYTAILLQYLQEIEKRGLHLELGFFNLHNFLTVEFKYSDSEAATRVQAMRLLKTYPEIKEKLACGAISLSQAADINRFIKSESSGLRLDPTACSSLNEKSLAAFTERYKRYISIEKIIKEVEGKGIRESREVLDKMRSAQKEKKYTIEIDEEAWQFLQEIKKLEGQSFGDGDFCKKIFKERLNELKSKIKRTEEKIKKNETNKTVQSRYVGKKLRLQLFKDANYQCEYISPLTGRRCECKSGLQVDHLYPQAWGGSNDIQNTRILCGQHNFFYGEQTLGIEKMACFRRR